MTLIEPITPEYSRLREAITERLNAHDLAGVMGHGAPEDGYNPEMEDFAALMGAVTTITGLATRDGVRLLGFQVRLAVRRLVFRSPKYLSQQRFGIVRGGLPELIYGDRRRGGGCFYDGLQREPWRELPIPAAVTAHFHGL